MELSPKLPTADTTRDQILLSILDTDLYKFSVAYAYMTLYPDAEGTFVFSDRSKKVWTDEEFAKLKENMRVISSLSMSTYQFNWCVKNLGTYLPENFWVWLSTFKYELDRVKMELDDARHLMISVTDKMHKVTLYEIPVLVVVAYTMGEDVSYNLQKTMLKLGVKIDLADSYGLTFSEFGTRRRLSAEIQDHVVRKLASECDSFVGTSNVHFACKYGLKAIGTYPHEWPMFHAAVTGGYIEANTRAMEDWVEVYDGYLGTALIDAFTTPVFLKNFSKKLACLFDGVRQDSGDEFEIGDMIINRYKQLGIDPKKKFIVFSNGLDFAKYKDIKRYFDGKIGVSAGIGTNLTNDPVLWTEEATAAYKPANIVMKLMKCRLNANQDWHNCIKISDDKGKEMGNESDILMAKYQIGMINSLVSYNSIYNFTKADAPDRV